MTSINRTALLVLDVINEIVHPDGKYAAEGYGEQARQKNLIGNIRTALDAARAEGLPVIFVSVGFDPTFSNCPSNSPVLSVAAKERRLIANTWSTQVHDDVAPRPNEPLLMKSSIDPYTTTNLHTLLAAYGVDHVVLTGISTEFVVLTTAFGAHDRNYKVTVLEDAVSASTLAGHRAALSVLSHLASISSVGDFVRSLGGLGETAPILFLETVDV